MSSLGVCATWNTDVWLFADAFGNTDDETDMEELEKVMRSIEMDGLTWGASKLVAVGYGISKLQVNLVVEDEKVSIDDLQGQIEGDEEHVQSTDVVSILFAPANHCANTSRSTGCYAKAVNFLLYFAAHGTICMPRIIHDSEIIPAGCAYVVHPTDDAMNSVDIDQMESCN